MMMPYEVWSFVLCCVADQVWVLDFKKKKKKKKEEEEEQ